MLRGILFYSVDGEALALVAWRSYVCPILRDREVRLDGVLGSLSLFEVALPMAGHGAAWALRSPSHSIERVKGQTLFAHFSLSCLKFLQLFS